MSNEQKVTRKLRAILSADVKGYSLLMADDEAYTVRKLEEYRTRMSNLIKANSGRVVDAVGDNLLAEFSSAVDAIQCAVEIQKALKAKNSELVKDKQLNFRIGVNVGDVIQDKDRIYGAGVNVAARIEGLADPGGICISRNAYDHIKDKLELGYEYLGDHEVKNIKDPVRVYKVLMDPEDAGKLIGEGPKRTKKKWVLPVVVVAAIIVTSIVWYFIQNIMKPYIEPASLDKMAYSLPDKPSIAVLPFDNLSGDPNQESLADGISESIITALSYIPDIFVIARNSTFTYKNKPVKIRQVAEEFGVRYVLEGSVLKAKEQIRITVQLIDATTGYHLWSKSYDRIVNDLFVLLDDITKTIAIELQIQISDKVAQLSGKTNNLEAWASTTEAYTLITRLGKENITRARELTEKAVKLDPQYGYAWSILAAAHFWDAAFGYSGSKAESFKKAVEFSSKALKLDNTLSCATVLQGLIFKAQGKLEEAIAAGKKSITMSPSVDVNYAMTAGIMWYAGRFDEAIALYKDAMRLNPYYPAMYLRGIGISYLMAEHYNEALETYQQLLNRAKKGEFPPIFAHIGLAAVFAELDKKEEASIHKSEIFKINPNFSLEVAKIIYNFHSPQHSERWISSLRKAGIPETPTLPLSDKPSIAVLPFANMSNDPEQEYFSDGMSDDIITDLSKIKDLLVISRNSTFTYKGQGKKIPEIARELNVRYVLEGSVRKAGDQIRINAQLIDAKTDHHVWAERFDGMLEDVFALQDRISTKIVAALAVKLSGSEQKVIADKGTHNIPAYDAYLRGMTHMRRFTPEDYVEAISYLKQAIELDQNYSHAYAALAYTYWTTFYSGRIFWEKIGIDYFSSRLLARHYLELAMEKPTSVGCQLMANMELWRRNYDEAIEFAEKAVAISPNDADALYNLGSVMVWTGNPEAGIEYFKRSLKLDPLHKTTLGIGMAYFMMEDYEKTLKYINIGMADNPNRTPSLAFTAAAYAFLGNDIEAKKALEKWLSNFSGPYPSTQMIYYLYAFKDVKVFDRLIEGLVKAGFRADPSDYYKVGQENKMNGQEIRELLFGKTQTGVLSGFQWSIDRDKEGEAQSKNPLVGEDKGRSWLESDAICNQFEISYNGLKYCEDIYQNPEGDKTTKTEYLALTDFLIIPFSVKE